MEIKITDRQEQSRYYDEILKLLSASDEEFVPPLSARCSTTQKDLSQKEKTGQGVLQYFENMKEQRIMVATEADKLLAFVSFREDYTNEEISEKDFPNIYISTLIVSPEGRGKRLAQSMYKVLFEKYKSANIFTRTWSANTAHIAILSKLQFETLKVLKDHRGKGIDTVYFVKRPL